MGGLKDSGHNAIRDIVTGVDSSADDINDLRSSTPLPHFPIAVVEEVYYDPINQINKEELVFLKSLGSPELAERVPRNAILARIITRGVDKSDSELKLFFPANTYDGQPIKPGESVFVFFSDPYVSTQIGFWLCRVPEPIDTDDINFTHADRKFEFNQDLTTSDRFNTSDTERPGFPNGGGTEDSSTTAHLDDFDRIEEEATANLVIIKEPVARFTKRPGDRVLQASNGARLVLGQERTSSASEIPEEQSPAIDIVATSYSFSDDNTDPEGSAPRVVTNTRGYRETDKNPKKQNAKGNSREGDPDFENDAARIYLSAKSNPDEAFSIEIPGILNADSNSSSITTKADQIRIIARQNVKIIVEDPNGGSSTALIMDGQDIAIIPSANGIVSVGKANAQQQQVRGNELLEKLNELIDELNNHTHPTSMGPTGTIINKFSKFLKKHFLSNKSTVE